MACQDRNEVYSEQMLIAGHLFTENLSLLNIELTN